MGEIQIRFYEELNDFLPPAARKCRYAVPCRGPRSVKDLIESQGVPHTEVDLILVNGESVGFDRQVDAGDDVAVYPRFEGMDIAAVSRLNRPPLREVKFVADVHLGKLVRRLRLLGFDCLEDRTRDRGLLMRAQVTHGIYIHSDQAMEQVAQVVRRLDLRDALRSLSRCLKCNGLLAEADRESVREHVPEFTFRHQTVFKRCQSCGKVFWPGTHWPKLQRFIEQVKEKGKDI